MGGCCFCNPEFGYTRCLFLRGIAIFPALLRIKQGKDEFQHASHTIFTPFCTNYHQVK